MWNLPGPGLEPMSPALVGGFLTTAPPGKSYLVSKSGRIEAFMNLLNLDKGKKHLKGSKGEL